MLLAPALTQAMVWLAMLYTNMTGPPQVVTLPTKADCLRVAAAHKRVLVAAGCTAQGARSRVVCVQVTR